MCRYSFLPSRGRRRGSNGGAPTPVRRWKGRSRDLTRKTPARYHAPVPVTVLRPSLHELVDIIEQIFIIAATCDLRDVTSEDREAGHPRLSGRAWPHRHPTARRAALELAIKATSLAAFRFARNK